MTSRRLLSVTASLALAAAGFIAPAFVTQGASAVASPTASASSSAPAYAPAAITAGTRVQSQAVATPTKRVRVRTRSNNPTVRLISLILAVLIVGGGILFRYVIFKATQRNSNPPTTFNGPNGPQYGVTGASYGTTTYPQTDATQLGAQSYGTQTYGNQPSSQGSYGTGF